MRRLVFLLAVVLGLPFGSASARPVVVELFTSEGCSSCPPADAYLNELASRRDVLPLAFHVTYWNYLGWRDPFSSQASTDRQGRYAARLGGGSYTPEIVVDGRRGMVGSDRGEVASTIEAARGQAAHSPTVSVSLKGGTIAISIGPGGAKGQVLLIGFDPRHQTLVGRGENAGHTLIESNIVRSIRAVAEYDGSALDLAETAGTGEDVAVLVQAPDGHIISAGRGASGDAARGL